MNVPHIVVVDDEADVREMVQEYLIDHGFVVTQAESGEALAALMRERPVDLALLDINMPGEDGLSIARSLKKRGDIGIIMLTANGDTVDRVVGLELGADDYVVKPFDLRELLARVRAVLRRISEADQSPSTMGEEIRFGSFVLSLASRRLYSVDGRDVPITAMEFDLLRVFAQNPGRVLSRDRILELAHSKEMEAFDRSVDTRIVRIRQKIEADPAFPQIIKTVRGAGYVFVPGASA
ncbi:MAG: DNA-binding response regulator [Alphaproteobacteria bacterium]|nr:MAG: DNA-binding response regulator [Alphaproteobacteria bacterium]